MLRHLLLCLSFFAINLYVQAQGQNNVWTFGHTNGLNFNNNPPTFFQSSNISLEGCASFSDSLGNLLFYSNGNDVWDNAGNIMPNGTGIQGNGPGFYNVPGSSAQGVAIVQRPNNHNQYYLFTLDAAEDINPGTYPGYLRYSLVDMTLNGGLGDVVSTQKNIVLDTAMSEKMTVTKGAGCYYWLVTHRNNSATYRAYKIDGAGIQPAVSSMGTWPGDIGAGQLKISPDGTKIATCNSIGGAGIEIGSFNNATGIISNTSIIDSISGLSRLGTCFSPDNSKLYITSFVNLAQYDLSNYPNFSAIEASKVVLSTGLSFSNLRNGPDGKIYISFFSGNPFIGTISNPNAAGLACTVNTSALPQPSWAPFTVTGAPYGHGLGNDIAFGLAPEITIEDTKDTTVCDNTTVTITAPSGFSQYLWNDGNTNQSRNITTGGIYWVSSSVDCSIQIDTFKVSYTNASVNLGPDTSICNQDQLLLDAGNPGATYIWQDGSTQATFLATDKGSYSVKIIKNGCTAADTISIDYINPYLKILEHDTLICEGDPITLHTNANPVSTYVWNTQEHTAAITVNKEGNYVVSATNVCGTFSDSIRIKTQDCDCNVFIPNAFTPNGDQKNDTYSIRPNCGTTGFTMDIYNRFGQRVFQTQSPDKSWDGYFQGKPVDVGTYFYYIKFKGPRGNDVIKKGDLELLR